MNLEPYVLLRLSGGAVAAALFGVGAVVSARVLSHGRLRAATEGRLALERHAELAATLVRIGTVAQALCLWLTLVSMDRLALAVRGAMCGYGVANQPFGWAALSFDVLASLGAGVLAQLLALDRRVESLELLTPIATATLLLFPVSLIDLVLTGRFLLGLDLTVVASCCSTGLDEVLARVDPSASRHAAAALSGVVAVLAAIGSALLASLRPSRRAAALAGVLTVLALPFALSAILYEVAPHVFETPWHKCPFCLLRADASFVGYPLFGSVLLAVTWGASAIIGSILARLPGVGEPYDQQVRGRMRRVALAWSVALLLGVAPVVRYQLDSPGASLFR